MEDGYLIVGLGNPGSEYELTRHNAGFLAVDRIGDRFRAKWDLHTKLESLLGRVEVEGKKVLLCKPQTFMNASGKAVSAVLRYFRIPLERVLVIVDDADLPLGEIRLRGAGSSGGHHGLESIESFVGGREYARLRVGIGRQAGGRREITGYVLGRFSPEQMVLVNSVLERVVRQVGCWVSSGLAKAMNEFNGVVKAPMAKES